MGVIVTIEQYKNIDYMEYYVTGFYLLKKMGVIEDLIINEKEINFINKLPFALTRLKRPRLRLRHSNNFEHDNLIGTISEGGNRKKFVINVQDTIWDFSTRELYESCDLFFKCQFPDDFNKGKVSLNKEFTRDLDDFVLKSPEKARPLVLGRPLSRISHFKNNLDILRSMEKRRAQNRNREHKLIFYTGASFQEKFSFHPNLKRLKLMMWIKENLPEVFTIFHLAESYPEGHPERKPVPDRVLQAVDSLRLNDRQYRDLTLNANATLNICGKRGSIPFRALDSYLAGMVFLTDELYANWYEPLVAGKDYYSLGTMGYELDELIDYDAIFQKVTEFVNDSDRLFREGFEYREEKYKKYYAPEAVATHILKECGFSLN